VLALAGAFWLLPAGSARSDLRGFTTGITHDLYTETHTARCVHGPNNCSLHSFTFASANDTADLNFVCAEIYNPNNHSNLIGSRCAVDFIRLCIGSTHDGSGDPLHCVDQDSNMYHAGARNELGNGTTIRRHVIY
jgi:hypothetical protein